MNTNNFTRLIQLITGRDLIIKTIDKELKPESEYFIYKDLPLTNSCSGFYWKTPKTEEKMLRSFITAFTSKFKEPNPKAYDYTAKMYGEKAKWEYKTDIEKEYAHRHHVSNMYGKDELLKQIESNFNSEGIKDGLIKYGFYPTEYGIGIFCFWLTNSVQNAIQHLTEYLNFNNIPYSNEYSDAKWVFRFKLGITKDAHTQIINSL